MFRSLHNTGRVFRNKVSEEVERIEKEKGNKVEFSDLAALVAGKYGREAEDADEPDGGIWTAGQTVGLLDDIPTCRELIARMAGDAEAAITQRLNGMVVPSKL
jgi:nitronate monooxygenase